MPDIDGPENDPRDQHPLDPDPPRPPGVPDLDLDIPISSIAAAGRTDGDDSADDAADDADAPDVDKEPTQAPD